MSQNRTQVHTVGQWGIVHIEGQQLLAQIEKITFFEGIEYVTIRIPALGNHTRTLYWNNFHPVQSCTPEANTSALITDTTGIIHQGRIVSVFGEFVLARIGGAVERVHRALVLATVGNQPLAQAS